METTMDPIITTPPPQTELTCEQLKKLFEDCVSSNEKKDCSTPLKQFENKCKKTVFLTPFTSLVNPLKK